MTVAATGTAGSGQTLRRTSLSAAMAEVLGSPARAVGLVVVSAAVALLYSVLLPYDYTQRFELANWQYLGPRLLAWAIVLGLGMGFVVSVQVYAMRRVAAARAATGAAGGLAFLASLAPSLLCCSPIIPTFLAFVGVSGVGLYTTSGTLQHFFALHQTQLLSASLALLVVTGWWGLRKVATAACLSEAGCDVGPGCAEPAVCEEDVSKDSPEDSAEGAASPPSETAGRR
jgi:hypothetical protein